MKRRRRRPETEIAFAKSRGWRAAREPFNLHELALGRRGGWNGSRYMTVHEEINLALDAYCNMADHCVCYVWVGTQQPAAIIAHPYGHYSTADAEAVAGRFGIRAETFRPSWWHNPDGQTIVLSAARDGPIRRGRHR
jgi:hypothetical protein